MTQGGRRLAAATVVVAQLLLAGYAGASSTATTESGAAAVRGFRSPRGYRPTPAPVRLQIPRIGVDTALQRLGKAADGTVQTPTGPHKWDQAGWYAGEGGTRPGDPGSAVVLGHVDSISGPAVFYRVRELRRGDQIKVTTADGTVFRFAVDRVEQYPKTRFPTADVYYPILTPKLRLVTCGGSFDFKVHHYRSNVIAFATLQP